MGLLNLLPKGLKQRLLVGIIKDGFERVEAQHFGQLLNEAMDRRAGREISDPVQQALAHWLRAVAAELTGGTDA